MKMYKKLFCVSIIPLVVFFSQANYSKADDTWQLDGNSAEMSDDEEIEQGKRVDEYIKHHFYLCNDAELIQAVNNIARKLIVLSDRKTLPFTCTIIQSRSINAFSAPGGYIYVTYGLLAFAKSEDEVAGIIGHEIAHASLRHVSRLYHEVMENSHGSESDLDVTLLLNNHLEEFEYEADSTGVFYAYKAGFNPNGLPDFLERHLDLMMSDRIFSLLNFSFSVKVNSRINLLRKYIPTLKKE
ncbi:MAG: M48 family metalloprotease [Candidatus Jettenia sp.]|nr:M48 family metalloprotease [Candidatus Jettenia sp.]